MKVLGMLVRHGLVSVQGMLRLFSAGAVIYEAHQLFLSYYSREWNGMLFSGVNGCQGESMVANGDLFEGQTFCNQPINFFPWLELYRRHWLAALLYYGVAAIVIILIGFAISAAQRRLAGRAPFGGPAAPPAPSSSEHLQ